MNCIEYYKQKYGIDISILHRDIRDSIASNFLENIDIPKERLERYIKKSDSIEGEVADNKSVEDIAEL